MQNQTCSQHTEKLVKITTKYLQFCDLWVRLQRAGEAVIFFFFLNITASILYNSTFCTMLLIFLRTKLKVGYVCENSIHFSYLGEESFEKEEHIAVQCAIKNLYFFFFLPFLYSLLPWFYKNRLIWPSDMPAVICSCCSPICTAHNICCNFEGYLAC